MFRSSTYRSVCLACRISSRSQQICRQVSTGSAINRGLRATQNDQGSKRGGRDRSSRPVARPRKLSDTYNVRSEHPRSQRSPRASFSSRPEAGERRPDASRQRDAGRPRTRLGRPAAAQTSFERRSSDETNGLNGSQRSLRSSFSPRAEPEERTRDRPWDRDAGRQRTRLVRPPTERPTSGRRFSGESDDIQDRPRPGLLREIKSACKLVQKIQQREQAGEGVDGLIKELRSFVNSINSFAKTGTFDEKPSEAVTSILQKYAGEGTFVRGEQRSSSRSVIRQRSDGELAVSVGTGGPVEQGHETYSPAVSRKSSQDARVERPERPERLERPERRSWSDAPSGRRREVSSSRDVDEDDEIPLPLPYTTAASEFLYGHNTVLAALRARQRKMYKLYIHPKIFDREAGAERGRGDKAANEFVTLAKEAGVPFRNEFKTKLLDRMSDGRPHNGVLLEASKLPTPPVLSLGKPNARDSTIPLALAQQSAEDAEINGMPETINSVANSWRHPLIVLLDGITDPGNLGNILRTCHFYGVDAVAVATNTCANLSSAVLAKASSGACEAVRLLSLPQPSSFAYESARNGWKIYASVAPTKDVIGQSTHLTTGSVAAASPLAKHPCILMLGAEGEGLRENLRNRAHSTVSIERGKKIRGTPNAGVDSINVSVAAGVLMDAFLSKPSDAPEKIDTTSDLGW